MNKKQANGGLDTARLAKDMISKRTADDVSLGALSKTTGIPKPTLYIIETGVVNRIDLLIGICNWLGKPVQHYLTAKIKPHAASSDNKK
jgi:hypothetical protein